MVELKDPQGQATVSLTPDVDSTGSGSLLDSVLSTLLKKKKRNSPVILGSSTFTSLKVHHFKIPV